jgi:hypothetical protein
MTGMKLIIRLLFQFMPLLHQYLLDKVGYAWTLRILALYMAVAAVSLLSSSVYFKLMPDVLLGYRGILCEPTYSHLLDYAGRPTADAVPSQSIPIHRVPGMFCDDPAARLRLLVSGMDFCTGRSR